MSRNDTPSLVVAERLLGGGGDPAAEALRDEQGRTLWTLVDSRMRGRWRVSLALGIFLGAVFGATAYITTEPKYQSIGVIQILGFKSAVLYPGSPETGMMPLYQDFVRTQVSLIKSRHVLELALQDDAMAEVPWARSLGATGRLRRAVGVSVQRASSLIEIRCRADVAKEAQAVVNSVIRAYESKHLLGSGSDIMERQATLHSLRADLLSQVSEKKRQTEELIRNSLWGGQDPSQFVMMKTLRKDELQFQVAAQRERLAVMQLHSQREPLQQTQVSSARLEAFDHDLAVLRLALNDAHTQMLEANRRFRPEHRAYQRAEEDLRFAEKQYDRQLAVTREAWMSAQEAGLIEAIETPESVAVHIARLEKEIDTYQTEIRTATGEFLRRRQLELDLANVSRDLEEVKARISQLIVETDSDGSSRVMVLDYGDRPIAPSKDRRRRLAALGAGGGLMIGFGFFFLLGTIDRRAFSTVQLRDARLGSRILGVLPDLGHRQLDSEACAVAAHCVHQIRNQIEAVRRHDQSAVIAVTSAYQGDGKTSIVLAIGGSYAAAGSRTVLVDCDIVGQSLSRQLGKIGQEGLREALQQRELNGLAVSVGTKNLSVLPVGMDAGFGAEDVRRGDIETIFEQLREEFDVILVDTGPMGSLEGLPVAAAADGVVVSVRRGRRQPRLEDCIKDLRAAGARCLGVVLNYAARADCDRYVSKSTLSLIDVAPLPSGNGTGAAAALVQAMEVVAQREPGDQEEQRPS